MPGFLGGSTSGGGTGGEIQFPKEFVDPVTKLRISQPETLIDTDFEYGLQPTKWETLELINNTPSFFSKSGDTTIPGIVSITTNAGTREITVTTALDHGLAVGIPINVQGTKSVTADGAYIINSIPNSTTFTYLCKDNQPDTLSIEDLYSSIITGEFFQGSQLRISDAEGITTDGEPVSTLTVTTESAHGFGVNTPFYFLNLNSTVAQEFEAANTAAKSFDSSNSATAQTFDGSNTLSQIQIDWSNSATIGGTPSSIVSVDSAADTITVTHTTETFVGQPLGTPLYYDVTSSAGYFSNNPRGVVFLKTTDQLASGTSIFQVSEVPDGDAINIEAAMTGTFQLANQARTFAGNNTNPNNQVVIDLLKDDARDFDGSNTDGNTATVTSYSGSLVNVTADSGLGDLGWYQNAMVLYTTTGSAASGLTNNTTYWIDTFLQSGSTANYSFTLKPQPDGSAISSISGGTGTQAFRKIGVSVDKDWLHVPNHGGVTGDMYRYEYPVGGALSTTEPAQNYYFIEEAIDSFNIKVSAERGGGLKDGSTEQRAAESAEAIKALTGTTTNGLYWIKLPNYSTAQRIFCIMDNAYDGGGWMLAFNLIASTNAGMPAGTAIWNNSFYTTQDGTFNTGNGLNTNQKTQAYGYHPASQVLFILHNRSDTSWRGGGRYILNASTTNKSLWTNMTQGPNNQVASSGRASTYGSGSGVPNNTCRPQTRGGDMFVDSRNSGDNLFFRVTNSNWFASNGYNRAHITTSAGQNNSSYGHTFGGIGGEHQHAGWNNGWKIAPISPYCDCPGYYGEGNGSPTGTNYTSQGSSLISSNCGTTSTSCPRVSGSNVIDVGYGVFVR